MEPDNQIDPNHGRKRGVLRLIGPIFLAVGLIFMLIGLIDFFRAMSGHGEPKLFWCLFVGMPLVFIGGVGIQAGFIGAVARYMAGESAPVAKDTFNYMADGTKEGVKTIAGAVGEGLAGAGIGKPVRVRCHKCNQLNDAASKFCKGCGTALLKTKACPGCNELNDPDAKFCDHCGRAMA
jgi:hypothetical protein